MNIPNTQLIDGDRAKLTTTLNILKRHRACAPRYEHLAKALGGVSFDHDAPINLLTILELNGAEDCLWALCATAENCERQARLIASDCAEAVLHLFEREMPNDSRPRVAIQTARRFARGLAARDELAAAWDAARDAAWDAARDAARAAARAAAWAAAWDAAWAAARAAAWDAQTERFRQMCREGGFFGETK